MQHTPFVSEKSKEANIKSFLKMDFGEILDIFSPISIFCK